MAKPPSDAPVLFDVYSDSSTIKQGKDGSYKLVLEGVEKIHWETDGAEAEEGYYSAKKYAKRFDTYYGKDAEVSAYQTFTLADRTKEKCKLTITDAKYNQKSNKLVYDIEPANKTQADKIAGVESEPQSESTVYSTERSRVTINWPFKFKKKYVDRISNFDPSTDILVIDTKSFAISPSSMAAFAKTPRDFILQHRTSFEFIYLERRGFLFFNENGSSAGFGRRGGIAAILEGAPVLTSDNLTFI